MTSTRPIHGGNLSWATSIAGGSTSAILDFSASINPLGIPPSAIATIQQNLFQLSHYPDPSYHQLRQSLADYHTISPDWLLPGNGSAELLTYVGRDLAQTALTYILTPAFHDYQRAIKAFNGKIKGCLIDLVNPPLSQLSGNKDHNYILSLASLLNGEKIPKNASLLLNNPHNPTGKLLTQEEIKSYLDQFALVVIDEAFMDFLPPDQQQSLIPLIADYPHLIILRSLTKFYSIPGLRMGYAIAHPDRLKKWQKWRDPWTVNTLADLVAQTVVKDQAFQIKTLNWLVPTRLNLLAGLRKIKGLTPFPSSANFLLVKTNYSSSQLQEQLLKKYHILIRDCLSFPELGDHYFRIAVKLETDNNLLLNALAEIL